MEEDVKAEQSDWVAKQDAAKTLGVTERQVEKRAQQGYLRKRFLPRLANEKTARVEYLREDIDALLCGKPNMWGEALPAQGPTLCEKKVDTGLQVAFNKQSGGLQPVTAIDGDFALQISNAINGACIDALLAKLSETYAPPPLKGFLTFAEAIAYSGHTPAKLAELLHSSQVDNYGRGPKTWRVRRASLDAYGGGAS
jgi:hypothetical protein